VIRRAFAIVLILSATGCSGLATGLIYTEVVRPYSYDYHDTKVGTKQCIFDSHSIKEPVSGYGVRVEWSLEEIQYAASQAGISEITCIDEQTLSILLGIYKRQRLIIYGN
jgi:hypothetical protein